MRRRLFEHPYRIVAFSLLLVLFGAVLSTSVAAADGGGFEVEIVNVDEKVDEGGNLIVLVDITNNGDTDTQDIILENGAGDEQAIEESVQINSGETEYVTLIWRGVPERPTRSITPTVRSNDDIDSESIDLLWSEFEVREVTVDYDATDTEVDATFNATVRNIGTDSDAQDINLDGPTGNVGTESLLQLNSTESKLVTLNTSIPKNQEDYTYTVSPSGDVDNSEEVTVREPPSFTVDIDSTSVEGTAFDLVATIENEGDFEATQDVKFAVDGETDQTREITLAPGESQTETFTYDTGTDTFDRSASVETELPDIETRRITTAEAEPEIHTVTPQYVQGGEELSVTYTADGPDLDTATVILTAPNGDTYSTDVDLGDDLTAQIPIPERNNLVEGNYDVTLQVQDDFGGTYSDTKENAFEADTVLDSTQVEFSETDYQSPAGDFVEVSISTGDLDEAYILIGGDREANEGNVQNYLDVLHVSGDATFVINTRLVGSDRESEDVYIPVDGEVTSYDHSIGAGSEPTGVFNGVSFEDKNGNEIAGTLAEFRIEMGLSERGSPLQAGRYRLVAGGSGTVIERDDEIPDFRQPVARSNLVFTQPEIGEVTTYTLPPAAADRIEQFDDTDESMGTGDIGSLLDAATETDRVARGDRILIEVQSVGMYGALMDDHASENSVVDTNQDGPGEIPADWVKTLLANHEGVHIELSDSELGAPNRRGSTLQFENVDKSDLYILPDDSADQWNTTDAIGTDPLIGGFYVVIDTRGDDPFDSQPRDGDELTFDIAYESPPDERFTYENYDFSSGAKPDPFPEMNEVGGVEHFPYFGSSDTTVSANDSFVFEDPYIDYGETTLNDELIVAAESGSTISGETNIAPGSQAEMQLVASNRPNPKTITIEDIEISEDRTFEITEDFSEFEPGERVEVEFYSQGRLIDNRLLDKRGVRVVDDLDNPATFEIESLTEEAEVVRGQRLSAIETTIVNTGEISDRQLVEFTLDGETIRNQTVTLEAGEDMSLDLSDEFVVLPVGEYEYTVRTEDDERTGQLTVTEPDSENDTRINSLDSEGPTVSGSPEGTGDPTESDPEGLFGLFGIRSRDVAVAATVTGAMHLLGQWT